MTTLETFPFTIERTVTIHVRRYTPGHPGRVGGAPEDCAPPQAPEIEVDAVLTDGNMWLCVTLSPEELDDVRAEYEDRMANAAADDFVGSDRRDDR